MQDTIAFKNRIEFIKFIRLSSIMANENYMRKWLDWIKCNQN